MILKSIPHHEHWAVLTERDVYVDSGWGDTNTETLLEYSDYTNEEELRIHLAVLDSRSKPYRVLRVNPFQVKKTITFEIADQPEIEAEPAQ